MGCSALPEEIIPFNLQLILKINFPQSFSGIHKLRKKKIGILYEDSLLIYSSNNFSKINHIEMDRNEILKFLDIKKVKDYYDNYYTSPEFNDFIEMKDSDLVLCAYKMILFYKLYGKEYKLNQVIGRNYEINSLYELSNGNLVSCGSFGMEIYYKIKVTNEYILLSKHNISEKYEYHFGYKMLGVLKIIEIKLNELIILKRYCKLRRCSRDSSFSDYSISIYNIDNKNEKILTSLHVSDDFIGITYMNYLIKNEYLFVRYGYKLDIYNIKNNVKLINKSNKTFETKEVEFEGIFGPIRRKVIQSKKEFNIVFLSNFDDFIFVKDINDIIKIYTFRNNRLKFYQTIPFQNKDINGIINLKNNNLLMYTSKELFIFKHL